MSARSYQNKIVVITGGSSGIGLALANIFATQNAQLVLIARDEAKLVAAKKAIEQMYSEKNVDVISADVSNKETITKAIDGIGEKYHKIDMLICSAGIMSFGKFKDQSVEDLEECMDVNYYGCMYAAHAAWKYLKEAKGQLSFVSSVAGYMGLFGYSSYTPSKFALMGLAECLRMEGKDDDINVSIIYPPDTETPFLEYEHAHTLPECKALAGNIKPKSADFVAKKYFNALRKNKFEIYCDAESILLRWFKNNFSGMANYFMWRIIEKSRKK